MMRVMFSLSLAAIVCGCATTVTPEDTGPYAPTKKSGKGIVAYNPNGLGDLVVMRRKDALKKIYEACGSNHYKIVKEEVAPPRKDMPETLSTFGAPDLKYLHYECEQ